MTEHDTISFIVEEIPEVPSGGRVSKDVGGGFGSGAPLAKGPKRVEIPVEKLKTQMSGMLIVVDQMFTQAQAQETSSRSGLKLDEVELSVEVSAEGQVSIMGTGVTTAGKGAITLKFKRSS